MCGITGILRLNPTNDLHIEIQRMTDSIRHRGPDGEGIFVKDNLALGHRRLAIIDLETGKQPMCNEDESLWLTYNGEIYNFKELRIELEKFGHRFKTNSDSEVIIHSYEQWGVNCLNKFRGMFAFCIADFSNRKLFLARDHFGIKPLVYRISSDYFAFSSELSSLRKINDKAPEGDIESLEFYLRYQYIPAPKTIYKKIYKLKPAHYLFVDFNNPEPIPIRYWDFEFNSYIDLREEEYEEQLESVLENSVKTHLVSDVPFGVFLSGGIDSTLVTQKMAKILSAPIKAFSIGFKEEKYSELKYAEIAAKKIGVEHHTYIIEENGLEILPELIQHYGEPYGDSSAIPTYYVSKYARQNVPMVLSGDGGDEFFGGYITYKRWMNYNPWKDFIKSLTNLKKRRTIRSFKEGMQYRTFHSFSKDRHNGDEWMKFMMFLKNNIRKSLWKKEFSSIMKSESELFLEAHNKAQKFDRLSYAQYIDINTYMQGDILYKVDIASMAHGLEVRPPIIDTEVLSLASRLPQYLKLQTNENSNGKYLLKKILGKTFDNSFIEREKKGFAIPRHEWFLFEGKSREMIRELILTDSAMIRNFFNSEMVKFYVHHHGKPKNYSGILWLLLALEMWFQQNKEISFNY